MKLHDMESDIMAVWSVTNDLEILAEYVIDGEKKLTEDDIFNIVYGLSNMLNIKCERLFSTYESLIKERYL
jgi:hypothetical protein